MHPFRYKILVALCLFYLVPIILLAFYGLGKPSFQTGWMMLSAGLLAAVAGIIVLFLLMLRWEREILATPPENVAEPEVKMAPTPCLDLDEEPSLIHVETLEKMKQLEAELAEEKHVAQTLQDTLRSLEEQVQKQALDLTEKQMLLQKEKECSSDKIKDLEKTVEEQKAALEKKQAEVEQLEVKIEDLTYEIKTLLHLADYEKNEADREEEALMGDTPPRVFSWQEASALLREYLDMAQKMTGLSQYHANDRFRELGVDTFSSDQRRLFDHLKQETGAVVFFYSLKDQKVLCVNEACRGLLGVSPEALVGNSLAILESDQQAWSEAISQLASKSEVQTTLQLKTPAGALVPVNLLLALVPTGVFRNHAFGILFPSKN